MRCVAARAMLLGWAAMLQPYTADPLGVAGFACMLNALLWLSLKVYCGSSHQPAATTCAANMWRLTGKATAC